MFLERKVAMLAEVLYYGHGKGKTKGADLKLIEKISWKSATGSESVME